MKPSPPVSPPVGRDDEYGRREIRIEIHRDGSVTSAEWSVVLHVKASCAEERAEVDILW